MPGQSDPQGLRVLASGWLGYDDAKGHAAVDVKLPGH